MKKRNLFLAAILILCISCNDQTNKESDASPELASPVIDSLIDAYVNAGKIPGGVALVAMNGELICHTASGKFSIEDDIPQQVSDIFRIASMTKQLTSVAAMIMYDEGKYELDDPLSKYIPEYAEMEILDEIFPEDSSYSSHPAKKQITIRQLFTHSSGICYGFDEENRGKIMAKAGLTEGFEERDILLADNVLKLADFPILHEPGERFTYGLSIDVLGRLVEIWSGIPLDEFFQTKIFDPLGMEDSHFYLPEEKYDRLPPVYMSGEKGVLLTDYPLTQYPVSGAKRYLSGGGDVNCTTYDYYLFCQMMLNDGELNGVRILKEKTARLMHETHLETGDWDMGLGFSVLSEKTNDTSPRSAGTYSGGGFFSTSYWIDPAEQLIAILMLQMYPMDDWKIHSEFEELVYKTFVE